MVASSCSDNDGMDNMQKYLSRKEKTEKIQLRYIDDIHVIDVFFVS